MSLLFYFTSLSTVPAPGSRTDISYDSSTGASPDTNSCTPGSTVSRRPKSVPGQPSTLTDQAGGGGRTNLDTSVPR